MRYLGLYIIAIMCFGVKSSLANSYLEMITAPPEGYEPQIALPQTVGHAPLWYDSRIQTSSPVVTSSLPKYLAWKRAKENEANFRYVRDDMQKMIYFFSGAFVARVAYDIWGPDHKHHLLFK